MSEWTRHKAVCLSCGNTWIAIAPDSRPTLECPECHAMAGETIDTIESLRSQISCAEEKNAKITEELRETYTLLAEALPYLIPTLSTAESIRSLLESTD